MIPEVEHHSELLGRMPRVREAPEFAFTLEALTGFQTRYVRAAWAAQMGHDEAAELLEMMGCIDSLPPNQHYNRACGSGRCAKALLAARAPESPTDDERAVLAHCQMRSLELFAGALAAVFFRRKRSPRWRGIPILTRSATGSPFHPIQRRGPGNLIVAEAASTMPRARAGEANDISELGER